MTDENQKIIIYEKEQEGFAVKDYLSIKNNLTNQIVSVIDKLDIDILIEFLEKISKENPDLNVNLRELKRDINRKRYDDYNIAEDKKVKMLEFDEQNAMFFIDKISNEITVTSNFFRIMGMQTKEYNFRTLVKEIFYKIEDGLNILKKLRNVLNANKEYMETIYLKSKKKIEVLYRIYEFEGYTGILFSLKKIDNMIPIVNYDSLTGTLNRKIILDKLEELTTSSLKKNISVLLINLNEFKNINNLFGYKLGDFVIKMVSKRIEETIRKYDILGRINGDEFILILTNYKKIENVEIISNRILEIIAEPILLVNKKYNVTASIGVSIFDEKTNNASKMMSAANLALLKAKEKGKNNYEFYEDSIHNIYITKIKLENDLKNAILNDEFVIEYQPQIDIQKKKMVGIEALVRWKHPKKGIISPEKFIPLAEKSGDIIPLGKLIMRKAIIETKEILAPYKLKLAINFSGKQFDDPDLVNIISNVITETAIDTKYIEIEITETTAMNNLEINVEKMKELRHLRLGLAIDDFGSGYSSLSYLRKFPITKLKIDRSFITNIVHDSGLQCIVKSIIEIGGSLGLEVIMEGIETKEEMKVLSKIGCKLFQGYYFEKPITVEQLKERLKNNDYIN